MTLFEKFLKKPTAFAIFLLLILFVAYGYQIQRMGFYWDDWQLVYLASLKTPQVFWGYYAFDRPLAAWLYVVLTPFLGVNPVAWQVFAILARWIGSLGLWQLVNQVWPNRRLEAGFAALLLAVYPGFSQQPISFTYSLFWVLFALFLWSLVASIYVIRQPKFAIFLTVLALLASLMETLSMEYVIGLELLRPILCGIVLVQLGRDRLQAIRQALVRWVPYFLVLCIFVYFRFIYFPSIHTDPEANAPLLLRDIFSSPLSAFPHLLQNMTQDISQALIFAWGKFLTPAEIDFSQMTFWVALLGGLGVAVIAIVLSLYQNKSEIDSQAGNLVPLQIVLVGLLAIILGGLPVWSTNRQVIVGMWSDRFSLSLMIGVVILMVGIAAWLTSRPLQKAVFLSLFLALGVAFQVQNTARYKLNWDAQKDYYWQLLWRAPGLKEGTAVLGDKVPFGLSAEYSTGFALNTIYPSKDIGNLPYWFYSGVSARGGAIPEYLENIPLNFNLRTINYESSTSNGVAVYYKYGLSCLRVMSKAETHFPNLNDSESELLAISHPERILENKSQSGFGEIVFGQEPQHTWCYYFQKMDLAAQQAEWQDVLSLYDESVGGGYAPRNGTEYMPVIKANANLARWTEAVDLTRQGLALTGSARQYFCDSWDQFGKLSMGNTPAMEMRIEMRCEEAQ